MKRVIEGSVLVAGLFLALTALESMDVSAAAGPVTSTENAAKVTISIGTEIIDGDTTYQIGYPVTMDGVTYEGYFPFSELEWPLDVTMGRMDASVAFNNGLRLNATLKKSMTDPDDNMEDRDWLTESDPGRLDVYSESYISDFNSYIFDFNVEYTFGSWDNVSLFAGLGYQYQKFEYKSNLIEQYSPSGLPGFDYTGDGSVSIGYEITYHMPYISLGTDIEFEKGFSMKASLAFSPYVDAEDEDDHFLREFGGRVTRSDMDGTAIMFNLAGKYHFTPIWFVELGLNAINIDVDGRMHQNYLWFGEYATNKVESESTQTSGYINLGATF